MSLVFLWDLTAAPRLGKLLLFSPPSLPIETQLTQNKTQAYKSPFVSPAWSPREGEHLSTTAQQCNPESATSSWWVLRTG